MRILFISLLISFFTLYFSIPIFKKFNLDIPNSRSSHTNEKPTSGGLIFSTYGVLFALASGSLIPLFSYPIAILGFLDDKFRISSIKRYFIQILTILFILLFSIYQEKISLISSLVNQINIINIFLILLIAISGTAIINFINFMDGIDGIVGSCMTIVFLSISIKSYPELFGLTGALIGFLLLNWYPSKIFMGDAGSTFLGCVFFGIIIKVNNFPDLFLTLNLLSPFLIDTISCILRRFFAGQNIFKAHRLHLYQRLTLTNLKHSHVSIIYLTSTLLVSLSYFLSNLYLGIISFFLILLIGIFLDLKVSVSFSKCIKDLNRSINL